MAYIVMAYGSRTTDGIYGFWLYDFCDVYLELAKLVVYSEDKADAASKAFTRQAPHWPLGPWAYCHRSHSPS